MAIHVTNFEIDDWFSFQSENVDLWITDPPYPFNSQNGTGRYKGMYKRFDWLSMKSVFLKMYAKTSDGGRAYVFCNRDGLFKTQSLLKSAGFRFLNILIWDKQHFGGGYHWRNQAEYIVYVSKGKPKCYVRGLSNIFNYKRPTKSSIIPGIGYDPSKTSSKPYEIWRDIIEHGSCEGDVIADPFAGTNPLCAALMIEPHLMRKAKDAYTNVYLT